MKTWDCFDTLIARRFFSPYSIFEEVGRRLKMPDFKEKRIEAERKSGSSYKDIYKNLQDIDPQIEIDVELEHCFPIVENIESVEDGDMIISDMYQTPEVILSMLRKCGLNKDIQLIVSSGGKHSGLLWQKLLKDNIKIIEHCGDNQHSDVNQATKYGFKARLCNKYKFTNFETTVSKNDFNMACLMRFLRLQYSNKLFSDINPIYSNMFWITQSHFNIPLLSLFSRYLEDLNEEYLFVYRDCNILHPLYESLTKKVCSDIQCSRLALNNGSEFFKAYANNLAQNKTFVDLHGTGTSIKKLFPNNKQIFLNGAYLINKPDEKIRFVIPSNISISDIVEKVNPYNLGCLIDVDKNGNFIRLDCEHDSDVLRLIEHSKKTAIENCHLFDIKRNDDLMNYLLHSNTVFETPQLVGAKIHFELHSV